MEFQKSFFEDEVRDGFYVPAMMKRAWASQLQILDDVDRVCRQNNIQYFAEWGTLLGAVRHNGFIPWDDDMDICMKRADYNRFLSIAEKQLPDGYSLFGIHNDPDVDNMLTRVINTRTIDFTSEFMSRFHGFPFCSGIDIFPLDFIAPNPEDDLFQRKVIEIVNSVAKVVGSTDLISSEIEEQLCKIEEMCAVRLNRGETLFQQLNMLVDKLCSLYTEDESDEVTIMTLWAENGTYKFPKSCYETSLQIPFEGMRIPVPAGYDYILKCKYGDYMKPVHTWDSHDYPYYQRQLQVLEEKTGAKLRQFGISFEEILKVEEKKVYIRQENKNPLKEENHRKKVLFIPYRPDTWRGLHSLWKTAFDAPGTDVCVLAVPYYYKNIDGSMEENFDLSRYPEEIQIISYEQYNIKEQHPDIIIIQNPYDEYNQTITISPEYYAKNLMEYTEQLIYVPYFMTDEIDPRDERALYSMKSYCLMPGVVYADEVIVQSEEMAELYIRKLCKMAGEESRGYWSKKIKGIGTPLQDVYELDADSEIPKDWENMLYNQNGNKKKVILMYTSADGILEHHRYMINKVKNTIDIFNKNQDDLLLLWYLEKDLEENVKKVNEDTWKEYCEILSHVNNNIIMVQDDKIKNAILLCDGYYGLWGTIAQKCRNQGKFALLINTDTVWN